MSAMQKPSRDARGKRPQFFDSQGLDYLMPMVMVLAEEFSVLCDRLDTFERIAAQKGVVLADDIDSFELDEEALNVREARRQAMFEKLFYVMRKEAADLSRQDTSAKYTETLDKIASGGN